MGISDELAKENCERGCDRKVRHTGVADVPNYIASVIISLSSLTSYKQIRM